MHAGLPPSPPSNPLGVSSIDDGSNQGRDFTPRVSDFGLARIALEEGNKHISTHVMGEVAAIASMCVQPEASQRFFMGEVIQVLQLVCSEFEETNYIKSSNFHEDDLAITKLEGKFFEASDEIVEFSECQKSRYGYQSSEESVRLSASELLSNSGRKFESFKKKSTLGPIATEKKRHFWQNLSGLLKGSTSDHGFSNKLWPGSR